MGSAFTDIVTSIDYPLFIVTVSADGERSGCLIGFATQCSIKPPRFLACLSKKNHTFGVAANADVLVVHPVAGADTSLAELFGGETGDEVDKFERCEWREGPGGTPVLAGIDNWFAGHILERIDLGDHVGYLLEPLEGEALDPDKPQLGFQEAKDIDPGHAP